MRLCAVMRERLYALPSVQQSHTEQWRLHVNAYARRARCVLRPYTVQASPLRGECLLVLIADTFPKEAAKQRSNEAARAPENRGSGSPSLGFVHALRRSRVPSPRTRDAHICHLQKLSRAKDLLTLTSRRPFSSRSCTGSLSPRAPRCA